MDGAFVHRAIDPWASEFANQLADSHTVYTYERRGRGNSGDTLPYTVEREIEDLAAVIEEAGGSAAVLGMSSGAVLALDAAAHGVPITRLAVYEPPFVVDDSRPPRPDSYLADVKAMLAEGRHGDAVAHAMTKAVGIPEQFVEGMRAEPFFAGMEAVAHTVAYDGEIMEGLMSGKPLPEDRWSSVTAPTLVLHGGASEPWLHNGARALGTVLPNAEVRQLADQTHEIEASVLAPVVKEHFAS